MDRIRRKPIQHEANEQEALFRWVAFVRGRFPNLICFIISRTAVAETDLKRRTLNGKE